jgi:hypothetical protein
MKAETFTLFRNLKFTGLALCFVMLPGNINAQGTLTGTGFNYTPSYLKVTGGGAMPDTTNGLSLVTVLMHKIGQWFRSDMPLPLGVPPQELGSFITYYRRYALSAMLGIAAEDDDDGAAAQATHKPPRAQVSDNVNYSTPPPSVDLEALVVESLTPPPDATNQHKFETAVVELVNRGAAALAVTNEIGDPFAEMQKRLAHTLGAHGVESAAELTKRPAQMKFYRDFEDTVKQLEANADAAAEVGL